MKSRWFVLFLLTTTIWAAGCTRDAGVEPFQPVPTSADDAADTPIPAASPVEADVATVEVDAQAAQTEDAAPDEAPVDGPASPTPAETDIPIITITDTPAPTDTDVPPTSTVPPSPTIQPTSTSVADDDDTEAVVGGSEVEAEAMEETDDTPDTPAAGFTPISPGGGIVNPPTSTPRPTSTPVLPEGADGDDALITPTQGDTLAGVPQDDDGCTYTVQAGDNAYRIAVNNNITLTELRTANSLAAVPVLQIGQVLDIPGCGQGTNVDTVQQPDDEAEADENTPPPPNGLTEYTVVAGDTLLAIARRFDTTITDIVEANDLANPDTLSIGQELLIPEGSASE